MSKDICSCGTPFMTFLAALSQTLHRCDRLCAGWSFINSPFIVLVFAEFAAMPFIPLAYQMPLRIAIAAIIWLFWSLWWRAGQTLITTEWQGVDRRALTIIRVMRQRKKPYYGVKRPAFWFRTGFAILCLPNGHQGAVFTYYRKAKRNEVLFDAYDITKTAQNQVALAYQQTGECPTQLPIA